MTWVPTKLLLLICEGMYLEKRRISKSSSLSQHHWHYLISLGFQVIFRFLSFSFYFIFFFCQKWMGESWNQNINSFRSFYFSSGKIGLKSLVECLPFFPEPQQWRGRKAQQSSLQRPWQTPSPPGITDQPSSKLLQKEGRGPGGAATLWASLAARPWEEEIWPVLEEAQAGSRITLLFFPDSCPPYTTCFHEISVERNHQERVPRSGKTHREILSSPSAPSLCCSKRWWLF